MDQIENDNLGTIENEEQADALLESIDAPSGQIQEAAPVQAQAPVDEWDLTVGGKQIKAKRDQVLQWAQMGYSAPDKIRKLSQDLDNYKKQETQWKSMEEKYGPIDAFVKEKPDFWDHVTKSYQERNQILQDQSNPLASVVQQLQSQVQDLVQYKNQIEERQTQAQMAQEDHSYLQTFEEMKKSYPDIDFITPDNEGKSLEYRVLEHAQENGIKNFKTAFRDFHHDELVKRAESKAKENLVKEKQKHSKLGVLGITPTPTKRAEAGNIRNKSYDDLTAEALQELGIS